MKMVIAFLFGENYKAINPESEEYKILMKQLEEKQMKTLSTHVDKSQLAN